MVPDTYTSYESRLYDLEADPGETVDVSDRHPDVHRFLLARLEEWSAGIPTAPERELDPELEETLRSLGYLE